MSNYYTNKDSLLALKDGLELNGWNIYGYTGGRWDEHNQDIFYPATWGGIALKNGFILVLDRQSGGTIGGDVVKVSYDQKIQSRINKLIALRDNHAASKGERENATQILENLSKRVEIKHVIKSDFAPVTYQGNPNGSKWHIEKDGVIIAKGRGVFMFYNLDRIFHDKANTTLLYKELKHNYLNNDVNGEFAYNWTPYFTPKHTTEQWLESNEKDREESTKLLNKFFNLLKKWDTTAQIKLGDGEEEKLTKIIIKKKILSHYDVKEVARETGYITCSNEWRRVGSIEKGNVYKIEENKEHNFTLSKKLTRKWIDSAKRSKIIKTEPRKNTKGDLYNTKWHKEGQIVNVELVPVYEVIEVEKWVKSRPPKNQPPTQKKHQKQKQQPRKQPKMYKKNY